VALLQRHDLLPHFEVTGLDGTRVAYSTIWQRKTLVLAMLPDWQPASRHYAGRLAGSLRDLHDDGTALIVTRDAVAGLPLPGVVIADQWGEIAHSVHSPRVNDLPPPSEIVEWVRHLQHRCPECEGEAK
jgi:hypothetical protein